MAKWALGRHGSTYRAPHSMRREGASLSRSLNSRDGRCAGNQHDFYKERWEAGESVTLHESWTVHELVVTGIVCVSVSYAWGLIGGRTSTLPDNRRNVGFNSRFQLQLNHENRTSSHSTRGILFSAPLPSVRFFGGTSLPLLVGLSPPSIYMARSLLGALVFVIFSLCRVRSGCCSDSGSGSSCTCCSVSGDRWPVATQSAPCPCPCPVSVIWA